MSRTPAMTPQQGKVCYSLSRTSLRRQIPNDLDKASELICDVCRLCTIFNIRGGLKPRLPSSEVTHTAVPRLLEMTHAKQGNSTRRLHHRASHLAAPMGTARNFGV